MVLLKSLIYITCIITFVFYLKPLLFFLKDGVLRDYGVSYDDKGNKKTLFTFHLFILVSSVFVYKLCQETHIVRHF
jgi:hypothetical protein